MDVTLAVLPDRATLPTGTLRCARIPNSRRSSQTITRTDGQRVRYTIEAICRVGSAPPEGTPITIGDVTGTIGATWIHDTPGPWMRHARIFVSTRTDVVGPLPSTATIIPATTSIDPYGTPVRAPGLASVAVACRIDPISAGEDHTDGQRRTQTWTLTIDADPATLGLDAYAALDIDGATYTLVGDPLPHTDIVGGVWSTATLRRTGPG